MLPHLQGQFANSLSIWPKIRFVTAQENPNVVSIRPLQGYSTDIRRVEKRLRRLSS
jgi:hypothetical protein